MIKQRFVAALSVVALALGLSGIVATQANAAGLITDANPGQEVCPNTGDGWVKFDGLSGTTFTVPEHDPAEGWSIDEVCYKAGTSVVYLDGVWVVTSTVPNPVGNNVQ